MNCYLLISSATRKSANTQCRAFECSRFQAAHTLSQFRYRNIRCATVIPYSHLCTVCPTLSTLHSSLAHASSRQTLHTPFLYLQPAIIPSPTLSCTCCMLSNPWHTPLLHILPAIIPSALHNTPYYTFYSPFLYIMSPTIP